MELVRGIVIGLIVLGVIFIIVSIVNNAENKARKEEARKQHEIEIDAYERVLEESNIIGNIKCKVLGSIFDNSLVFTNDNRLYMVNRSHFVLEYISFENILDVKMEYKILEQNKMKLLSIKPTFDTYTKFESCMLKLILDDKTISFSYLPNYLSNGCFEKDAVSQTKYQAIDSMERMKLLIERELKKIN